MGVSPCTARKAGNNVDHKEGMTALASWCAWDQHGHSAIYLAADSLITWDDGRHSLEPKLFAHGSEPQIVGYCDDRDWGRSGNLFQFSNLSSLVRENLEPLVVRPSGDRQA